MKKKILIIASNYYKEIAENLILGVDEYLTNFNSLVIETINVSGSFEIPYVINKKKDHYDGFIALGCIIRGETYHFEIISNEVTRKIMDLTININKPVGFGVLTCENMEQAIKRSDPKQDNKGYEAAKACIDLLNID